MPPCLPPTAERTAWLWWGPADERPELVTGSIAWQPVPEGPALTIDLDAYFAKVWI